MAEVVKTMKKEELVGGVITDVEIHCENHTDVLTVWVRIPDGRLVMLMPADYRFDVRPCPWSEEFHGGKKNV